MTNYSSEIILKALDCLSARSEVTAQNVANMSTPGYRPLRVTFETALRGAAHQSLQAIRDLKPKIEAQPSSGSDSGGRVDLELTTASATTLRYAALVEILNRQEQRNSLALSGSS